MGRKFIRMSLGGVKDEAEIRGHRRTYVGALPGRVIQGIKKAGTNNPVVVLDEVDKIGQDFRGDPSSALLEVLDPAQNSTFEDHYLNVAFDLSGVMFICTANFTDPIPPALLDRMEVIRLSGYTREEKLKIGRKYILPRQMSEQGITEAHIRFSDEALSAVTDQYTRESGLRNFEREIANICRKVARKVAEGEDKLHIIGKGNLPKYLGPPIFLGEEGLEEDLLGVTNGLAWTQSGGDILFIEATTTHGHGKLILTGQLGDVMKESAQTAFSWARGKAEEYGVDNEFFDKRQFHVHVPAGAIPKDGPSAGITIATSLLSLMTGRPVDSKLAMTGEISLRGRVLPIGGVKEKCLAARRAGIKRIILPERNRKDLAELPPEARKSLEFHFVTTMDQVAELALKPKAKPYTKPAAKPAAKPKAKARLPETKPKAKPGKTTKKK
jgi:ATP-dependent Lon protease